MRSHQAGVSRSKILEMLEGRELSSNELAELVGISSGNVGRHMVAMESDGLVKRRHIKGTHFAWSLADSGAHPEPPAGPPLSFAGAIVGGEARRLQPQSESDRVSLAEQLVDVERAIAELVARRAEILRVLA